MCPLTTLINGTLYFSGKPLYKLDLIQIQKRPGYFLMWDYKSIKKHDEVRNFAIKAELTNQNLHNIAMKDRFHLT